MQLRDRWALVTGAAKRVGRSIALELATRGMNVVVHYGSSVADAERTLEELRAHGVSAFGLRADLFHPTEVATLAGEAERQTGGITVLVNSAANYLRAPFDALTESTWDQSIDVNLKAPFLLSWHVGRAMRARGEGAIVNIADWAGERPYEEYLPYCVSKAGVICLTKALAKALAPAVRVNAVAPGPVMLPEEMGTQERAAVERATPLRHIGRPEDVARCVRFVAEEADFSTGAIFHVDGGRLIA
jgi:NAD(P)-dependent dehydrogenase (short-subunit alcohol dehydrogenase family)